LTWFIHGIDVATGAASLGVKFIGLPSQIRANHTAWRESLPAGLVWKAATAMCLSYLLWVVHGIAHGDPVEIVSQGFGVITTAILAAQAVLCARRSRAAREWEAARVAALHTLTVKRSHLASGLDEYLP
jgi:lipid-A-disaccharide synthase-like uncharacterized protein